MLARQDTTDTEADTEDVAVEGATDVTATRDVTAIQAIEHDKTAVNTAGVTVAVPTPAKSAKPLLKATTHYLC